MGIFQGCGLGLEAVSRRSSASARSRLGVGTPRSWYASASSRSPALKALVSVSHRLNCQCLGLGSVSTKKASCTSLLYNLTSSYRKGYNDAGVAIKDKTRNLLTEQEETDVRWKKYFETLLNVSENLTHVEDNINMESEIKLDDTAVTMEQVQKAVSYMKKR